MQEIVEKEVVVEKEVIVEVEKIVKEDNSAELKQLQLKISELEVALEEEKAKPPEVQVRVATPTVVEKRIEVPKDPKPRKAPKKEEPAAAPVIKEVIKEVESPELKKQLEKSLHVEKELRAANKALEAALEEAKTKAKYRGPQGETRNVDEEIAEAMEKV